MNQQIVNLIKSIIPYYNKYKLEKDKLTGTNALYIMWDIGDLLKVHINTYQVAPHNLYRQVYGKSEGKDNIEQKSYITREFQGRCFRIRNIFLNREDITKKLPKLNSFTCFREAMPFFDNPIYKLSDNDFQELLKLLNSKQKPSEILKKLDAQKKAINDVSNSRVQKIDELETEKQTFITFYNYIYKLGSTSSYHEAITAFSIRDTEIIKAISKNLNFLSQEGLQKTDLEEIEITNPIVNDFYFFLKKINSSKNEKERRRFRRIIQPERIIRLAELVFALTSEKQFLSKR